MRTVLVYSTDNHACVSRPSTFYNTGPTINTYVSPGNGYAQPIVVGDVEDEDLGFCGSIALITFVVGYLLGLTNRD